MDQDKDLIAFMDLFSTSGEGYLGAVFITDRLGVPQEFRCTHSVKPNKVQKMLYGDTLQPHVGVNLCGIPLIKQITNKPSLIIIRKDFFLGMRPEIEFPVVLVRRAGETIEVSDSGNEKGKRDRIECPSGKFQSIIIESHTEFNDDSRIGKEFLEKLFSSFDPIEPFERMEKAVEVLGNQKEEFR